MKKLILPIIMLLALFACKGSGYKAETEEVEACLQKIYSCPVEERQFGDYCSKEFLELLESADALTPEGMMGPIDFDPWIMGQDYDDVKMKVLDVSFDSSTSAEAEIEIENFGEKHTQTLAMVKEEGVWKVDNFMWVLDNETFTVKRMMEEYIESNQK